MDQESVRPLTVGDLLILLSVLPSDLLVFHDAPNCLAYVSELSVSRRSLTKEPGVPGGLVRDAKLRIGGQSIWSGPPAPLVLRGRWPTRRSSVVDALDIIREADRKR